MRLIQLRKAVRNRLGLPSTDTFQTDEVIDAAINEAIQEIETEHRWPWTERMESWTTTDDSGDMPVPTGWTATKALGVAGDTQIRFISNVDLIQYDADDIGHPNVFGLVNDTFKFRPRPAAGVEIQHVYYVGSTLLVGDGDEPTMPTDYSPVIIAKACELLLDRAGETTRSAKQGTAYAAGISKMRKQVRRTTQPTRTRVRPGSWV